jgi:hypothetical protein
MDRTSRRHFLQQVGGAMLAAGVGSQMSAHLGVNLAWAEESAPRLSFGPLEELAGLMQDTPADRLLPQLAARWKQGLDARTLLAAGALANARTFGGEDYIGFHTFMALGPAGEMSRALSGPEAALPVFKVLYRNAARIQAFGGQPAEVLHPVTPADGDVTAESFLTAARQPDVAAAEAQFAALVRDSSDTAYHTLQGLVQDEEDVHRVVLAWRAWSSLDLTGTEHAHSLLRQSVRYCCRVEQRIRERNSQPSRIRTVLPRLMDQYRLHDRPLGDQRVDDRWIAEFAQLCYGTDRDRAADAVAAALADGVSPQAVAEALSVAATQLVLNDPGREERWANGEKPAGSVHGDSVGVHASDAANAWRNIAAVCPPQQAMASLIVGAHHTAGQSQRMSAEAFPAVSADESLSGLDAEQLLRETETAIQGNDQARAVQVVRHFGERQLPTAPLFEVLLRHSVSADGALHAEKYFQTVMESYAATRPAYRWGHITALARVVASEAGRPAPGLEQARELLGVSRGG